MNNTVDIKENYIFKLGNGLLEILLQDHSSGKNIIWATDNYSERGIGYRFNDNITIQNITGYNGRVIKPRTEKSKEEQAERVRKKAEVFTPSWICNAQNNLVDNAWFESEGMFNTEHDKTWTESTEKVPFPSPSGKTWQDYIDDTRLEITCGEAPYLVSRYDAVTGEAIDIKRRIGLLDRKLRVISENVDNESDWYSWAKKAFQNTYGFEWQGDNVLLARENLLFTFIDYYQDKFGMFPNIEYLKEIALIVSWNIWQMDGLKFVIPESCKNRKNDDFTLFSEEIPNEPCEGCKKNNPYAHKGIYCKIMDWKENQVVKFVNLLKK